MFRKNDSFRPKTKTVNFIYLNGGLGDHVAALVVNDYIAKRYPWVKQLLYMPDFLVDFARHLLPDTISISGFSQMRSHYQPKRPTKTTKWDGHVSPMKTHCLDYAFLKLCDENPPVEDKNYLQIRPELIDISRFNLPNKYVVMTTGYTTAVREFKAKHVNTIVKHCKDKGFEVVFLGQKQTKTGAAHVIQGNFDEALAINEGIDLIDKTTLLEATKIMGQSAAVIGVDNGLLHVAGCTEAYIVGGFTTVPPEARMPVRHGVLGWNYYPVVPDSSLDCRFCQAKTNFLYGHNYTKCIYKDSICTDQMTAEKFIKGLESI